jgi:hypothetical protein
MSEHPIMNLGEIEQYIKFVRDAQQPDSSCVNATRLEHIKVLALLTIAQKLAVIEELGIEVRR